MRLDISISGVAVTEEEQGETSLFTPEQLEPLRKEGQLFADMVKRAQDADFQAFLDQVTSKGDTNSDQVDEVKPTDFLENLREACSVLQPGEIFNANLFRNEANTC